MTILFALSIFCLIVFMILATYDGAYLHLWKYELFAHEESLFEHKTHTIRAILFPLICYLFFIDTSYTGFIIGLILFALDLITLVVDAYSEKDSRTFMGGLPRWEYILHLFSNSFHFAAIILIIATRLRISSHSIQYSTLYKNSAVLDLVHSIAINILPGAILLAIIHVFLSFDFGKEIYFKLRRQIKCC